MLLTNMDYDDDFEMLFYQTDKAIKQNEKHHSRCESQCDQICEILAFWNNKIKAGKTLMLYLVFGKILNLLWQKCYAIGQISVVVNCQILHSYLAIWSLCWGSKS